MSATEYASFETSPHSTASTPLSLDLVQLNSTQLASDTLDSLDTEDDGSALNDNISPFFLSVSRRIISDTNCSEYRADPEYLLLIAFLPPPLLEMATKPATILSTQMHWTSRVSASPSRLSGWKDANTLYSHQHARFS
ncbi:hypothetical protein [Vibrio methylphosphonaticus]|uniref:hypothetical protein n=1 Tax=Vibrio methylphosphonaticus TaxID=2946866 RepID=UPI002029F988|nr:hypothetical protein [Vibrio methylphosphonaticus]MCL9777295.1 hypothetical protein [Vibrio methylphosphonaticus]